MNAEIDLSGVILKTERLILREWTLQDLDDFYAYCKDKDVGPRAGWNPHQNKEESLYHLNNFIKGKKTFCIEYNKKAIGSIGIETYREEDYPELNSLKGRELGFVLSKDYWGLGLMPEAVKRVMRFLFEECDLDFITCCHNVDNYQSKRVQEKVGFSFYRFGERTSRNGTVTRTQFNLVKKDDFIQNKLLYNALFFNNANVMLQDDEHIEIDDKKANIYYLFAKKENIPFFKYIEKNRNKRGVLCLISQDDLSLNVVSPFTKLRKTIQYSYVGGIKEIHCPYSICAMKKEDFYYFVHTYDYDGQDKKDYLLDIFQRGMLKAVNDKNEIVGYIGQHKELTIGALYIDPNYRRKGIGKALEQAMINQLLKEGITPINHVIVSNHVSKMLQSSFEGMKLDDGFVYWLF